MNRLTDEIWIGSRNDPDFLGVLKAFTASLAEKNPDPLSADNDPRIELQLPYLCARAVGANLDHAGLVTRVWLLFQIAAQLLDTIEDGDKKGQELTRYSPGALINISTSLIILAEQTLSELENRTNIQVDVAIDLRVHFNHHILNMCGGQHADLSGTVKTLEACWKSAEAKSGEFFALACYAGARLGTNDPAILNSYRKFGQCIGTISQIKDDITGLWDEGVNKSDLAKSDYSLPVAYALSVLPDEQANVLRELIENPQGDHAVEQARKIIVESGAVLYLSMEIKKRKLLAVGLLSEVYSPYDGTAYQQLLRILDHVANMEEEAIIRN